MSVSLLAITPPAGPLEPDIVRTWADAGALQASFAVLLRDPGSPPLHVLAPEHRLAGLRRRCRDEGVKTIVSCDCRDLDEKTSKLLEGQVDGIQVRGDPSPDALQVIRARWSGLLGRSVHGRPQPGSEHVDYTVFAPVFAPATPSPGMKKHPAGLAALRRWTQTGAWIVALGGVGRATASQCVGAGASGLASIRSFFGDRARVAEDVAALVAALGLRHDEETPT